MKNKILVVIGLGYVGLPITLKFSKKITTFGFDNDVSRINELKNGYDINNEFKKKKLIENQNLSFTFSEKIISNADYIIVTVPTPINRYKKPDFNPLNSACKSIGKNLKKKSIIIFESTVYPGATKEKCIPIIEKYSNKIWKKDFHVGYSPERANVGDKTKSFEKIVKIISGDSKECLGKIFKLYNLVTNKLYKANSIEIAEAAKSIENTQRDLNIGLMNEFAIICDRLKLNTKEVLDAAKTKWNFINFNPGLVGGHCIGVDPYYLSYKSETLNYTPELINSSRKINNLMPIFIKDKIIKILKKKTKTKTKILICGLTFKENCNDIRNSKIFDLIKMLKSYNFKISLHDPYAVKENVYSLYKENIIEWSSTKDNYDLIILSLNHHFYHKLGLKKIYSKIKKNGNMFDIKSAFYNAKYISKYKINYWSL